MDTSYPPPPDGDPIGPKWGADYQSRHPDDGVPAGGPVDPPADDGSPAAQLAAPGEVIGEATGPITDGARLMGGLLDTADLIDPDAPDPEPAAVQPWEPDWVDPDTTALPVDPQLLHDATAALAEGLDVPAPLLGGES